MVNLFCQPYLCQLISVTSGVEIYFGKCMMVVEVKAPIVMLGVFIVTFVLTGFLIYVEFRAHN